VSILSSPYLIAWVVFALWAAVLVCGTVSGVLLTTGWARNRRRP
jgi:hypothetical protein